MSKLKVFKGTPAVYGVDYHRGWFGFNHADSWFSKGIALFQSWEQESPITVSHVFIVKDENLCVEAAHPRGVVESRLDVEYWNKPERSVVFRKPKNLTPDLADKIVSLAEAEVGTGFDYLTVANLALQKNFMGWVLNQAFNNKPLETVAEMIQDDNRWLCSAFASYCLKAQPQYDGVGVLQLPPNAITPQELFEADEIFEPFES
jgi:hypothetical protein